MTHKDLLISIAYEVNQLLSEYVSVHNKRLQTAGTFRSFFNDVDFGEIYKDIDEVKRKFESKDRELEKVKGHYVSFTGVEKRFSDTLNSYFKALFDTVKQLHLLTFRQYEASQGFLHNKRKLSWSENSELEKAYQEKIEAYTMLGGQLNEALQILEGEPSSSIIDRKKRLIEILGENIDPEDMPNLYRMAKKNLKGLEEQVLSVAQAWHEGSITSAMQALESDLAHN